MHLSLTKRRQDLLNHATVLFADIRVVQFAFSGVNCQLKVQLGDKIQGKYIHSFNSDKDLATILGIIE